MISRRRRVCVIIAQIATCAGLLAWWQSASPGVAAGISHPTDVFDALHAWLSTPLTRNYIPVTVGEAALGLFYAFVLGTVTAVILASVPTLARLLDPFIAVIASLPKLALAPLFLVFFGFGTASKVYFVATALWFIPFQATYTALTTIDKTLLTNTRMLGARFHHTVTAVYIPAILSAVITSLRITAAFSLTAAVISELLASTEGIGYHIQLAQGSLQPSIVMAGVLIVGVLGLVADRLLALLDRRLRRWA